VKKETKDKPAADAKAKDSKPAGKTAANGSD
jgi:hypothetical protein